MSFRCLEIYRKHWFGGTAKCLRCGVLRADVVRQKWQDFTKKHPDRFRLYRQLNPRRASLSDKIHRAKKLGQFELVEYLKKQREKYPLRKANGRIKAGSA